MALFEGTVAYVMISASMKSMDPALEESARVMGASKLRTTLTVTLPLVLPGVLGATLFVFAEMLGSFAAALVLGIPGRIYVITTSIWSTRRGLPAELRQGRRHGPVAVPGHGGDADALPLDRHAAAATRRSPARRSGRARWIWAASAWVLFSICLLYIFLAVILPVAALLLTSFQTFATVILRQAKFTLRQLPGGAGARARAPRRWSTASCSGIGVAIDRRRSSWRCWSGSSTARSMRGPRR